MIGKRSKIYCCEDLSLIENYDKAINDNTKIWDVHHRLEIREDGTLVSSKELIEKGLYWHRPANELIFLTKAEHNRLHNYNMREETKQKMRSKKLTEESKRKISEARKKYWENKKNDASVSLF